MVVSALRCMQHIVFMIMNLFINIEKKTETDEGVIHVFIASRNTFYKIKVLYFLCNFAKGGNDLFSDAFATAV